jgi:hypothetical protein
MPTILASSKPFLCCWFIGTSHHYVKMSHLRKIFESRSPLRHFPQNGNKYRKNTTARDDWQPISNPSALPPIQGALWPWPD